tara:strand:+ start:8 stop:1171 length:1164 start_codon:yes stop_codon:yes gene_type:complete
MSEVRVNNLSNESLTGGPTISGITTFSSPYFFVPPQGDTASRPQSCPSGSLRFNTDSSKLEYYKGDTIGWVEIDATSEELGGGTGSNTGLGTRGLLGGGSPDNSNGTNTITFITISTLGADQDFGDLTDIRKQAGGASSRTRGLFSGGSRPGFTSNVTDFVTIASTGNAQDFGDNYNDNGTGQGEQYGGTSNGTRAVWNGGYRSGTNINTISYNTISSTGNALDFGDRTTGGFSLGAVNSTTRSIAAGGTNPGVLNIIDFVIMSTLGNASDFGDLSVYGPVSAGCNATRGIFARGNSGGANAQNTIEFITMATTGDATDFGDLTQSRWESGGMSSPTRVVFAGGLTPTIVNTIDYIEISTTGNAVDFGDTGSDFSMRAGISNGHGGL